MSIASNKKLKVDIMIIKLQFDTGLFNEDSAFYMHWQRV